ncbi:MAG: hypothetical protein M3Q58_11030 [Bacteroidota bacterium]|nr:hypothetical protein [Bacteroidota bacterium]
MSDVIYPRLNGLVSLSQLPEQLSVVQGGVNQLLNGLFYDNLFITPHSRVCEKIEPQPQVTSPGAIIYKHPA